MEPPGICLSSPNSRSWYSTNGFISFYNVTDCVGNPIFVLPNDGSCVNDPTSLSSNPVSYAMKTIGGTYVIAGTLYQDSKCTVTPFNEYVPVSFCSPENLSPSLVTAQYSYNSSYVFLNYYHTTNCSGAVMKTLYYPIGCINSVYTNVFTFSSSSTTATPGPSNEGLMFYPSMTLLIVAALLTFIL